MNRQLHKAIGLVLASFSTTSLAINGFGKDLTSVSSSGTTFVTDKVPVYAWSAIDSTRGTPTVFNANSKDLGWAHNSKWYDIAITKAGNYRISAQALNPAAQPALNPAFTLWPVHRDYPFDPKNCAPTPKEAGTCGDASGGGTHSYNQVAAPSPTNSSAWLLGPNGPDVNPDGEKMAQSLKWTPRAGYWYVTGFIGYANSGTGGPGATTWKAGLPRDTTGGRYGSYTYFSFGNDQNEVLQGGFVNTGAGQGLGGTSLDRRSNVDAPLRGGYAAMNLYGLAAGHYLMALGGSCIKGDCGSGEGGYRLEITEITGLPEAKATVNSPVRAGATATLDGSSSISADGTKPKNYVWTQLTGPTVTLSPGANSATQTFVVPAGAVNTPISFELRVDDGKLQSNPVTVSVAANNTNNPPTIKAGSQSVIEGATVNISPTVTDSDGDAIASYRWEQTQGPTVLLSNPNGKDTSFTAPLVGSGTDPLVLSFNLTATDNYGFNPKATTTAITINVSRDPLRLDCSRATASPSSLWPPNRQMKPVTIAGIYSPNNAPYSVTIETVTQDEPVRDKTARDTTGPDGQIVRGKATKKRPKVDRVLLRAERQTRQKNGAGSDNGRVYRVNFKASGNAQTCSGAVAVAVPPSQGSSAVDDVIRNDSTKKK